VNMGKHHSIEQEPAEGYGKHHAARAGGLSVTELLRQMVARGEAIRLAWRGNDTADIVDPSAEYPTAILPAIRDDAPSIDDEDTEPTTATRATRSWLRPASFSWSSTVLAG
jgi:hypothetical protein